MTTHVRARWVLPIERPPIENGWVTIEDGVIQAVGKGRPPTADVTDLGDAAILPGLINAHTHLELSWLGGRIPPAASMDRWIRGLMAARREPPHEDQQRDLAVAALRDVRATGTIAFGDISNTLITAPVLAGAGVPSVLFHELLGFAAHDAETRAADGAERVVRATASPEGLRHPTASRHPVRPGLAPHAPYSTSPELFAAIAREAARGLRSSVHLAESQEEVEFLQTGRGAIAEMLKDLGVWRDDWAAPRLDPVEYLDTLGVLAPGLLIVHATQLGHDALATLASRGCVIVSCPRSNRWTGVGDPPIDDFYKSGASVAFGTDSLASAGSLDMFDELAAARRASTVPAARLIESATHGGAIALGLDAEYGRIAPGLRGPLLAVRVPDDVTDVEQYLVAGEHTERQWVG